MVQKTWPPSASSSLALLFSSRFSFSNPPLIRLESHPPPISPTENSFFPFSFSFLLSSLLFFFFLHYPRWIIIDRRENGGISAGERKMDGFTRTMDRNEVGSVEEGSNDGCFCGRKRVCGGSKKIRQGRLAWSSPLASNFFGKCCPFRCAL